MVDGQHCFQAIEPFYVWQAIIDLSTLRPYNIIRQELIRLQKTLLLAKIAINITFIFC